MMALVRIHKEVMLSPDIILGREWQMFFREMCAGECRPGLHRDLPVSH
jgi:hypothetical protein